MDYPKSVPHIIQGFFISFQKPVQHTVYTNIFPHRTVHRLRSNIATVHNRADRSVLHLSDYARVCIANGGTHIHAKELTNRVKIFTRWDGEKYTLGKPGDYLAVRCDDKHDIYVVERDIFFKTYERTESH